MWKPIKLKVRQQLLIGTEYNPTSGPSGVYEGPKSGFSAGQTSPQMTGPTYPVAAQVYNNNHQKNSTAPVTQSTFSYPFPGYSSVSLLHPCLQNRLFLRHHIANGTSATDVLCKRWRIPQGYAGW